MASNLEKNIERILHFILTENKKYTPNSIPESDFLIRRMGQILTESPSTIRKMLTALAESGYLFAFPMIAADNELFIDETHGYVVSKIEVIGHLKMAFERELQTYYKQKFDKVKLAPDIVKELLPRIASYNNSYLGKLILGTHYLRDAETKLAESPNDYSEATCSAKLSDSIRAEFGAEAVSPGGISIGGAQSQGGGDASAGDSDGGPGNLNPGPPSPPGPQTAGASPNFDSGPDAGGATGDNRRAVDDPRYKQFQASGDASWDRAVNEFSVSFLLRIHFRKNEFSVIRKLITKGRIAQEKDLKTVLSMIKTLEANIDFKPDLAAHKQDILSLKRTTLTYIGKAQGR